jgi:hypothetical protein
LAFAVEIEGLLIELGVGRRIQRARRQLPQGRIDFTR